MTRDAAGLLLPIEHKDAGHAKASKGPRGSQARRAATDDEGIGPQGLSHERPRRAPARPP